MEPQEMDMDLGVPSGTTLEFLGLEIRPADAVVINVSEMTNESGEHVHLTNVAICKAGKDGVYAITLTRDETEYTLCTLVMDAKRGIYKTDTTVDVTLSEGQYLIRNYGPSPVSVTGYSNKMGLLDEEDEGVTFQSDSEEDDQDDSEPEEERQVKVKALKKAVAGANKGMRFLAGMDGGAEEDDDDEDPDYEDMSDDEDDDSEDGEDEEMEMSDGDEIVELDYDSEEADAFLEKEAKRHFKEDADLDDDEEEEDDSEDDEVGTDSDQDEQTREKNEAPRALTGDLLAELQALANEARSARERMEANGEDWENYELSGEEEDEEEEEGGLSDISEEAEEAAPAPKAKAAPTAKPAPTPAKAPLSAKRPAEPPASTPAGPSAKKAKPDATPATGPKSGGTAPTPAKTPTQAGGDEASYVSALHAHLQGKPPLPLGKLGSEVKKPEAIRMKMGEVLKKHADKFKIENGHVSAL